MIAVIAWYKDDIETTGDRYDSVECDTIDEARAWAAQFESDGIFEKIEIEEVEPE